MLACVIEPGQHYDADCDLTPVSVGHDLRLKRVKINLAGARTVAFLSSDTPDTTIYAEGTPEDLAQLLRQHHYNVV